MILDKIGLEHCVPIRIGNGPSLSGSRIGGSPPKGVYPSRLAEADYLLTLALEDYKFNEVSLFANRDWWDFFYDRLRIVSSDSEPWIEFVVHGPSIRATTDNRRDLLPPHPFAFGSAILDRQGYDSEDNEAIPLSDHKLGGRPYFIKSAPDLVSAVQKLEQNRYRQLLQLSFPGSQDATIDSDWPFGDGLFNLFVRSDNDEYHWCYFWQF